MSPAPYLLPCDRPAAHTAAAVCSPGCTGLRPALVSLPSAQARWTGQSPMAIPQASCPAWRLRVAPPAGTPPASRAARLGGCRAGRTCSGLGRREQDTACHHGGHSLWGCGPLHGHLRRDTAWAHSRCHGLQGGCPSSPTCSDSARLCDCYGRGRLLAEPVESPRRRGLSPTLGPRGLTAARVCQGLDGGLGSREPLEGVSRTHMEQHALWTSQWPAPGSGVPRFCPSRGAGRASLQVRDRDGRGSPVLQPRFGKEPPSRRGRQGAGRCRQPRARGRPGCSLGGASPSRPPTSPLAWADAARDVAQVCGSRPA